MKAYVSLIVNKIHKLDNNIALLKGYQSNEDKDGNKQYKNIDVFFKYSDNTVDNVKAIAQQIKEEDYAIVEMFSINNANHNKREYKGKEFYTTTINTNYVRLKELGDK